MSLKPVPNPDPDRKQPGVPPWNHPNLRKFCGKEDEAKGDKVDARITPSMGRAVSKLIQQRILPELENRSDVVVAGVNMVLWFARVKGKNSPDFHHAIDLMAWTQEIEYRERYYERVGGLLDRLRFQLEQARTKNRPKAFRALFATLEQNREHIEDEELALIAQRMWMDFREHMQELNKQDKGLTT